MIEILLVEDEPGMVQFLQMELELQGYHVDVSYTGLGGISLVQEKQFDAIFLDIMLPDMNGVDVCKEIRKQSHAPIIMLTARGSVEDRVLGLDAGADDYLVKPFAIEELMARTRALTRRSVNQTPGEESRQLKAGDICICTDRHRVLFKGQSVDVTIREYDLLLYLMQNPDRVFTRHNLLQQVWEFQAPVDTNVVDVYIGYLRQKLDKDKEHIQTVRGMGYVFRMVTS